MIQTSNGALPISADQIERIVREVLSSLASGPETLPPEAIPLATGAMRPATSVQSAVQSPASTSNQSSAVHLNAAVLSLDTLRGLPKDTKQITLAPTTLVTPAAKDYLREKGILWSKADSVAATSAKVLVAQGALGGNPLVDKKSDLSDSKRLLVTGSVLWLRNLEKQLCPKATRIDQIQIDDAATVRAVAQAIRGGAASAVAIVKSPHSTLWQAARDEALRPSIISQWSDLTEVLREVPTNMLIVPASKWNIAGTANITRKFLEHIQANR